MKCSKCGAEVEANSAFCTECGADLKPVEEPKQQAPQTTVATNQYGNGGEQVNVAQPNGSQAMYQQPNQQVGPQAGYQQPIQPGNPQGGYQQPIPNYPPTNQQKSGVMKYIIFGIVIIVAVIIGVIVGGMNSKGGNDQSASKQTQVQQESKAKQSQEENTETVKKYTPSQARERLFYLGKDEESNSQKIVDFARAINANIINKDELLNIRDGLNNLEKDIVELNKEVKEVNQSDYGNPVQTKRGQLLEKLSDLDITRIHSLQAGIDDILAGRSPTSSFKIGTSASYEHDDVEEEYGKTFNN